ncbi:MAG TPA: type II toxin-antitoxin system RelE/ParE family toxin [Anaerolineae bacterium]|nr:type II toxin-antitoxin system RelE/ParE family toxin [Anaerolineae bacterium]
MAYRIEVERRARKALTRLPGRAQKQVLAAIDDLADTPRPPGRLPVRAAPKGTYRIRVGRYRVIYVVSDEDEVVVVAKIAPRTESTYRGI